VDFHQDFLSLLSRFTTLEQEFKAAEYQIINSNTRDIDLESKLDKSMSDKLRELED